LKGFQWIPVFLPIRTHYFFKLIENVFYKRRQIMIVQLDQLYVDAMKRRYIVGAFNVFNYDSLCAVLEAAEEEQSPVILQVSMGARKYVPDFRQFIEVMKIAALSVSVPVGINHDHCPTAEAAMQAVDAGVGGVMFDGSHLSFEENVRFTREVVEYAHARGVCVEAELGRLPGFEDEIFADHVEFTNPDAAKRFVTLTGCDSLAVSAGTSHGGVKAAENLPLHMEVLERIQAELPGFPLVLHGAASLPLHLIEYVNEQGGRVEVMKNCSESSIRRSAEYGVCKANMDVDNFLAFTGAVRRVLREQPDKYDPRVYLKQGKDAWKEEVMWKMSQVTGSSGHNWVKEGVSQ